MFGLVGLVAAIIMFATVWPSPQRAVAGYWKCSNSCCGSNQFITGYDAAAYDLSCALNGGADGCFFTPDSSGDKTVATCQSTHNIVMDCYTKSLTDLHTCSGFGQIRCDSTTEVLNSKGQPGAGSGSV